MQQSPTDPPDRLTYRRVTWNDVAVTFALLAAIPLLFWAASDPLAAGVALAAVATATVAARRARRLARCVRACCGLAVDLPGTVRVTVAWEPDCDPN